MLQHTFIFHEEISQHVVQILLLKHERTCGRFVVEGWPGRTAKTQQKP